MFFKGLCLSAGQFDLAENLILPINVQIDNLESNFSVIEHVCYTVFCIRWLVNPKLFKKQDRLSPVESSHVSKTVSKMNEDCKAVRSTRQKVPFGSIKSSSGFK